MKPSPSPGLRGWFARAACLPAMLALGAMAPRGADAAVVSFPYFNDFSSSVADFATGGGGSWGLNIGAGIYSNIIGTSETVGSRTVQLPKFAAPQNGGMFRMETRFMLNSFSSATTTVGFGALGSNSNLAGTGSFYLADIQLGQSGGTLRLFRINVGGTNVALGSATLGGAALALDTAYDLVLTGVYAPNGNLTLSIALAGGGKSGSHSATILAANVLQGENFGFRNRTAGGTLGVDFDFFAITPEPGRALLLLLGGIGLLARRRR